MELRSLSYSTLLKQLSFSSQVIDKGDYVVIKTPGLPFYYWGNFILFPDPPGADSLSIWAEKFREEFRNIECNHIAFVWDSPTGEAGDLVLFEQDGYYFQFDEILTAKSVLQHKFFDPNLEVRILETDADWEQRIALNSACGDGRSAVELAKMGEHYRGDTVKGYSMFLGAFENGQLIGEMAVFQAGEAKGIIGLVKTHPDFRGRGVCHTLLYQAVQLGKDLLGCQEFVMVADVKENSASIYKALGFEVVQHGACLIKHL